MAGLSEEEDAKYDIASMTDEELHSLVRRRLLGTMENNGARQKVVAVDEVESYITQGWEYAGSLPNGKAILKLPL